MMGRRLEVASGGPMKLKHGLEVWRKCLQPGRRVRVKDMLMVIWWLEASRRVAFRKTYTLKAELKVERLRNQTRKLAELSFVFRGGGKDQLLGKKYAG